MEHTIGLQLIASGVGGIYNVALIFVPYYQGVRTYQA